MSYDSGNDLKLWVRDLDDYVNLDAIFSEYEAKRQEQLLNDKLDEVGEIRLFADKSVSFRTLHSRGISPEKWRWIKYAVDKSLGQVKDAAGLEARFYRSVIVSGRRYAVARYARAENLSLASATTATFPYGIRALIYQFMASEPTLADRSRSRPSRWCNFPDGLRS